jgi:hypothetical protein
MPKLHLGIAAPSQTTFLVSVATAIIAWIGYFASIPFVGQHPSGLLTVAFCSSNGGLLAGVLRIRRRVRMRKTPAAVASPRPGPQSRPQATEARRDYFRQLREVCGLCHCGSHAAGGR